MWNSLSENVVTANTLLTFQRGQDRYWENQDQFYNYRAVITTGQDSLESDSEETELVQEADDYLLSEEDLHAQKPEHMKNGKGMEQDDFEEGEILDSEEETDTTEVKKEEKSSVAQEAEPDILDTYNVITRPSESRSNAYRHSNTLNNQSDEDDDSSAGSDEDTDLWKLKKSKYFANRTSDKDFEISDVIKSPVRPNRNGSAQSNISSARNINFGEKRKKQNNVWGSVLTEQSLSQTMGAIGVERKEHVTNSYRNVEAYDYLKAHEDDRPFEEGTSDKPESMDPFNKVIDSDNEHDHNDKGNKRRKRQQHRHHNRKDNKRQKRYRTCNPDDSDEVIVKTIVENLNEEKSHLIERILGVIGKKKSIELMYATEDIEEQGGMKTNDGYRRRTPGGVYIQLIKQDDDITKEMVDEIFAEEQKKYRKELHKKSKQRQKQRRQLMQMLPQNSFMNMTNKGNNKQKEKEEKSKDNSSDDDDEMELGDTDKKKDENNTNTSLQSNDDDFLNRSEDHLDIFLGEEETLE